MASKETTQYLLADAIKDLMRTQSLDKITVTDIVSRCHLTRQTFYRHFQDKYDLVNWYFEKLAQRSFKQMGVSYTLREGLLKKFQFLRAEQSFFSQAFRSNDCNSLIQYDYECILAFYTGVIIHKSGQPLGEDTSFLLRMYCRGSIAMTVEWAVGGMCLPPERMADLLIQALPPPLEGLLSDLRPGE